MTAGDKPHRRITRRLSEHEAALWREVTRSLAPLRLRPEAARASAAERHATEAPGPKPPPHPVPPHGSAPKVQPAHVARAPVLAPIDRRFRLRLSRGQEPIEARVDLHGMRQNEAHEALIRFLRGAQVRGLRNVLVITGKGDRTASHDPQAERGILRRQTPLWLRLPELRDVVLGFEQAHASHGGDGALYVRLRRRRGESVTE